MAEHLLCSNVSKNLGGSAGVKHAQNILQLSLIPCGPNPKCKCSSRQIPPSQNTPVCLVRIVLQMSGVVNMSPSGLRVRPMTSQLPVLANAMLFRIGSTSFRLRFCTSAPIISSIRQHATTTDQQVMLVRLSLPHFIIPHTHIYSFTPS